MGRSIFEVLADVADILLSIASRIYLPYTGFVSISFMHRVVCQINLGKEMAFFLEQQQVIGHKCL